MKLTIPTIASTLVLLSLDVTAQEFSGYGAVHVSADSISVDDKRHSHIASNSSHIGLKGDYQLNNNLNVIFQYETGVDVTGQGDNDGNSAGDNYNNKIFTHIRTSFIGVRGSLGKVQIGHMPALDQWANDYNLFANQIGDLRNIWGGTGVPSRADNVIYYSSPKFQNLGIDLTYKSEEGQDENSHIIIKGNYAHNRLKVGVALASFEQDGDHSNDHSIAAITSSYSFDYFSFGAGLQSEFNVEGQTDNDRDSFFIGSTVSLTNKAKFKVQFSKSLGSGIDRDATLFALGYDYQLNSNTLLYVAYANMANDYNTNFSVNGAGHGEKLELELGERPSAFSLGMVYKFDANLMNTFN